MQRCCLLVLSVSLMASTGLSATISSKSIGDGGAGAHTVPVSRADTLFLPVPVQVESTAASAPRGPVNCGLSDRSGRLWFGTSEGLMRFDGRSFTRFTEVDSLRDTRGYVNWEHIRTIFEDRDGRIWFGVPNGVYRYDGHTFTRWEIPARDFKDRNDYPSPESRLSNPLPPTAVISILQDRRGALWFGTWGGGVNRYDGTTLTNLSETNGLCSNVVQDILEDRKGRMWFATRGGGVCCYDGRSFLTYATKGDAISYHSIFIAADSAEVLWVGSVGGGLRRFDGTGFVPVAEPDLVNVTCMLQRRNGERWYSSDGSGVYRHDGHAFTRFTTKDGMSSNSVQAIVEDKSGSLWFCTRKGLCRYDGRAFTRFPEK